jgi:transcriptional regulator with GAF, ATPase, and Fis domain
LLSGETGVGKGVLARYIHTRSIEAARRVGAAPVSGEPPFVHVNASALPANLIEGELFGHERGAFTDAREAKPGLFEMADGGTIFLDEIGEMPLELQAKLLLVVETGMLRRLGGRKEKRVRVRVVAASNLDLEHQVELGKFRRDLLYRLNAFTIRIPALRERAGDARLIAGVLLERTARRYGRPGMSFTPAAVEAIERHSWPGNVRELTNAVQRAVMMASSPLIEPGDLMLESSEADDDSHAHHHALVPMGLARGHAGNNGHGQAASPAGGIRFDFTSGPHTAEEVEKLLMMQALEFTSGNVSRAAKLIGMQRSSFRYRIDRYNLSQYVLEASRR